MPTGAAGGNGQLLQLADLVIADLHLVEEDLPTVLRDAAQRSVADSARLLVNFLEHEMLVAALLRHDWVPGNMLYLAHHRLAVKIHQPHSRRSDDGKVA